MTKVIEIPRKVKRKYNKIIRTVAYCRVSGKEEEQLGSIENQIKHYEQTITSNVKLRLVKIYHDYAKSGLRIEGRDAFKHMIKDAKQKKFNLIITKSISRFSRNTVDLVETMRILKKYDIHVYFEEENLHTEKLKSEMYLSLYAAIAQEYSRSRSEDIKWGIQRKMERGERIVKPIYGYNKEYGRLLINYEQAEIVEKIYEMYLEGKTYKQIAEYLNSNNIESPTKGCKWNPKFIERTLSSEKYIGDAIHQKTYTHDYLRSKRLVNMGEEDKYVITNNHEAIISEEVYNKVQEEKQKRSRFYIDNNGNKVFKKHQYSRYELTNTLKCEYCGANYRRRTERGKVVYRCATRMDKGRDACPNSKTHVESDFKVSSNYRTD